MLQHEHFFFVKEEHMIFDPYTFPAAWTKTHVEHPVYFRNWEFFWALFW